MAAPTARAALADFDLDILAPLKPAKPYHGDVTSIAAATWETGHYVLGVRGRESGVAATTPIAAGRRMLRAIDAYPGSASATAAFTTLAVNRSGDSAATSTAPTRASSNDG